MATGVNNLIPYVYALEALVLGMPRWTGQTGCQWTRRGLQIVLTDQHSGEFIIFSNFWALKGACAPPVFHSLCSPPLGPSRADFTHFHSLPPSLPFPPHPGIWVRDLLVIMIEMTDGCPISILTSSYLLYFPLSVFVTHTLMQEREMKVSIITSPPDRRSKFGLSFPAAKPKKITHQFCNFILSVSLECKY